MILEAIAPLFKPDETAVARFLTLGDQGQITHQIFKSNTDKIGLFGSALTSDLVRFYEALEYLIVRAVEAQTNPKRQNEDFAAERLKQLADCRDVAETIRDRLAAML